MSCWPDLRVATSVKYHEVIQIIIGPNVLRTGRKSVLSSSSSETVYCRSTVKAAFYNPYLHLLGGDL